MADKSERKRGMIVMRESIPDMLAKLHARVAVHNAAETRRTRIRQHTTNAKRPKTV